MLFTRECDYAIRIIRALSSEEAVSVPKICQMENLPSAMTYKITRKLEKSGLLKSYRGSSGGYALARSLSSISLYDICEIVSPDILTFECMKKDHYCPMNRSDAPCKVHYEFSRLRKILVQELGNLWQIFYGKGFFLPILTKLVKFKGGTL